MYFQNSIDHFTFHLPPPAINYLDEELLTTNTISCINNENKLQTFFVRINFIFSRLTFLFLLETQDD